MIFTNKNDIYSQQLCEQCERVRNNAGNLKCEEYIKMNKKAIILVGVIAAIMFSNVIANSNKEATVIAVGDIMLSRGVDMVSNRFHDYYYPFAKIGSYLQTAPIVVGNLESTITPGPKIAINEMTLRAEPGVIPTLKRAGIKVLTIANNHIADFGKQGIINTITNLQEAGIQVAGASINQSSVQQPAIVTINGIRIAFLAYCDQYLLRSKILDELQPANIAFMNIKQMRKDIQAAKSHADFVIVSMHAGNEYQHQPIQKQIMFAHAAIDAGAEIVLGHHPHVIQPVENYHGKYIFYSLGNFIFDQNKNLDVRTGLMLRISFNAKGVTKILLLPTRMENYAQPERLTGASAKQIIQRNIAPI